jgi:FtsP/CotA-like multicopper oxidase with cupredoxin domain
MIGSDGGLLERPVTLDRVRLSPGERAEIVVVAEPGQQAVSSRDTPTDLATRTPSR